MRASEADAGSDRWLLIGNSRWHWAAIRGGVLETWHSPAGPDGGPAPVAWAAVGPVPAGGGFLPPERRLRLEEVPLGGVPPWLGIDRALAGWLAWRGSGRPVLVADAGTVLSFTRVDAGGGFAGGRLLAGVGLQLRAMAAGTDQLPSPGSHDRRGAGRLDAWPAATREAMVAGVQRGLAAALAAAAGEVLREQPRCRLVLTGGDAGVLLGLLAADPSGGGGVFEHCPDLCLEALAQLRPGDQASPRSVRI